jgi:hypothetical protein
MSSFDERQKGFEKKFEKDQELQFKATARRNKLAGLWAAGLMGLNGDAAETYAKEVVKADFEEAGDDDVVRKLVADLKAKNIAQSEHQIRRKLDELFGVAREQLFKEVK